MHTRFVPFFISIALLDWLCVVLMLNYVWPNPLSFQVFLFLVFMGIFASATPIYYHLGLRFPRLQPRKGIWPPVRRGFITAFYSFSCLLLKVMQAINGIIALLLLGIFVMLELLFTVLID